MMTVYKMVIDNGKDALFSGIIKCDYSNIKIRTDNRANANQKFNQTCIEWIQSERNRKRFYGTIVNQDGSNLQDIYPDIDNKDNGQEADGFTEWNFNFKPYSN